MMDKIIRVFSSLDKLYQEAADQFAGIVKQAVQLRGKAIVTLSGGSTPLRLYHLLAKSPYQRSIPWNVVNFYWGDERCVPPDDPESNFGQVKKILLDHVAVSPANIHRVHGELPPEQAAEDYKRELAKNGTPEQPWPQMDYTLMGLGSDGHTASLFPGKINHQEETSPVIVTTGDYLNRPGQRVTLTPKVFNTSREVVFIVTGANKAAILSAVLNSPYSPENLPAQRIHPDYGTLTWLVDSSAAKFIRNGVQK